MNTACWFFMMTGEPDIPTGNTALARAHSKAAIEVLVEIMTQADASFAKTALEIPGQRNGWLNRCTSSAVTGAG